MGTTRSTCIATIASTLVLGTSLTSCLRPPTQSAPLASNVAAAPAPATPVKAAAPVKVRQVPGLPSSFSWNSSEPVISPRAVEGLDIVAIKDPTIVRFKDRYHVYASSVARGGIYGMVYTSFADWADAPKASFYPMKKTPGFDTYVAAPQLFYFSPKKLWYLVFQSGPPMYSTSEDPTDPSKWTPPMPFYPRTPKVIDENGGWLDFWVICDTKDCHLFFSNDHGRFYKSKTAIDRFPRGFGEPAVVMEDGEAGRLFEACNVYKIKGSGSYLALVEAFDKSSEYRRYFRSWTADSLEGPWTVLHDDAEAPFMGSRNVSYAGAPWSEDISHGEMVRDGYDETMVIDGSHLQFVYQGFPKDKKTSDYNAIPWQLGLLTAK